MIQSWQLARANREIGTQRDKIDRLKVLLYKSIKEELGISEKEYKEIMEYKE